MQPTPSVGSVKEDDADYQSPFSWLMGGGGVSTVYRGVEGSFPAGSLPGESKTAKVK